MDEIPKKKMSNPSSQGPSSSLPNNRSASPETPDSVFDEDNEKSSTLARSLPGDLAAESVDNQEFHEIVDVDSNITAYVAEDVTGKIKQAAASASASSVFSGPRSRSLSSSSLSSSGWTSTYGPSNAISRSSSFPTHFVDDVPQIDPHVIRDLDTHARRLGDQLQSLATSLKANLSKMSHLTVGCMKVHSQSVDFTCDGVDASIKMMYTLMAKCEEISKSMSSVGGLRQEINDMKRVLDRLEPVMRDYST